MRSALLLGATRLALWVLPFSLARRLFARAPRPPTATRATEDRIAWAISVAHRFVPQATCLPQALAAEALLTREGHPAELRFGVLKTDQGRFVAHAWVESAGRIVVGELHEGLDRLTPMPTLPGARL
jgi:hypothetical protein